MNKWLNQDVIILNTQIQKYQTQQMNNILTNNIYGVEYYQYINNIEEIGEKLYMDAFEKISIT